MKSKAHKITTKKISFEITDRFIIYYFIDFFFFNLFVH